MEGRRAASPTETASPPGGDGRTRPLPPAGINHVWAYDFVFDACANGQTAKTIDDTRAFPWLTDDPLYDLGPPDTAHDTL